MITLATTLMNRESDIKKTLPINLEVLKEFPNINMLVLNYNSKGDLSEWIVQHLDNPQLSYFEEREAEHFSMSRAKNLSVRLAKSDFVVNLDADNFIDKDFLEQLTHRVTAGADYIVPILPFKNCGVDGRIGFKKTIFEKHRGYDESMTGWGFEDSDLLMRVVKSKAKRGHIIFKTVNAIQQTDIEKVESYQDTDKDRMLSGRRNYQIAQKENRVINADGFGCGIIYDKNNNKIILQNI